MDRDWKRLDDRLVKPFKRTVTRSQHVVTSELKGIAQKFSTALTLDPTQNPKTMDVLISAEAREKAS